MFVSDTAPFKGQSGDDHTGNPQFELAFRKGMQRLTGVSRILGNSHWWIRPGDRPLVRFEWHVQGEDHNGTDYHVEYSRWEISIEAWQNIVESVDVAKEAYRKAFFRLWHRIRELFPSGSIESIDLHRLRFRLSNVKEKKKRSKERQLSAFRARLDQIKKDPRPYAPGKNLSKVGKKGHVIAEHKQFGAVKQSVTLERRKVVIGGKRSRSVTRVVAVQRWYKRGKVTTARVVWKPRK